MGELKITGEIMSNMEYDQFIRAISLDPNKKVSFFLGAGASVESGVLSAADCILEWKKQIYDTNNAHSPFRTANFKAEACKKAVQKWIDAQGIYPSMGDDKEYSFFAEKTYPNEPDRCTYFNSKFSGISNISAGYKMLAYFAKQGFVNKVWTTNFDDLIQKAMTEQGVSQIDVTLDCSARVNNRINPNNIMTIKLHGDYKYSSMKNTATELDYQEAIFIDALAETAKGTDLIVLGYSGRDKSIMTAFLSAFSQSGTGRLFWIGMESFPNKKVQDLLESISANNRKAFYVSGNGFDSVMLDIADAVFGRDIEKKSELSKLLSKIELRKTKDFSAIEGKPNGLLSTNAFLIKLPTFYYQFELTEAEKREWKTKFRPIVDASRRIVAECFKGCLLFLGDKDEIQKIFARNLQLASVPFDNTNTKQYVIFGLMRKALVQAIVAQNPNLETDKGSRYIWDKTKCLKRNSSGGKYESFDGIELELGFNSTHKSYNLIMISPKPHFTCDLEIWDKQVVKSMSDDFFARVNKNLKSNSGVYGYVIDWHTMITAGNNQKEFCFGENQEIKFIIGKQTALIGLLNSSQTIFQIPQTRVIYNAIIHKDPLLSFYDKNRAQLVEDFHPMRGLQNYAPYDFMYAPTGITEDVKIAVVLPQGEKQNLSNFLLQLNSRQEVIKNSVYLLPYAGFLNTYKMPITIPPTNSTLWQEYQVSQKNSVEETSRQLAENIITAIKNIYATNTDCVIIVYIPKTLERFEGYDTVREKFDLHDYVKAFCIPKAIPTQFIREKTIEYDDIASVAWTLSLALYVKAGRTPWVISKLTDEQTAFVGIGYSVDTKNEKNPIVLGCSHIFSTDGQSIRYRLSRVRNPQFDKSDKHRKNPYLTEEEAYRLGLRINDMFHKAFSNYPKRIVFHKMTPFKQCEIDGIKKSFSLYGITEIDLLTITYEHDLRAFQLKNDLSADDYPLRRGVGFVTDEKTLYLYTHGVANPSGKGNYVLGGKSLPIPLKITKYYGNSTAEKIANDVLGLTRMNWNNFNLYSKLPCTIESSNNIARIGYLLSAFDGAEYDYRLFI